MDFLLCLTPGRTLPLLPFQLGLIDRMSGWGRRVLYERYILATMAYVAVILAKPPRAFA